MFYHPTAEGLITSFCRQAPQHWTQSRENYDSPTVHRSGITREKGSHVHARYPPGATSQNLVSIPILHFRSDHIAKHLAILHHRAHQRRSISLTRPSHARDSTSALGADPETLKSSPAAADQCARCLQAHPYRYPLVGLLAKPDDPGALALNLGPLACLYPLPLVFCRFINNPASGVIPESLPHLPGPNSARDIFLRATSAVLPQRRTGLVCLLGSAAGMAAGRSSYFLAFFSLRHAGLTWGSERRLIIIPWRPVRALGLHFDPRQTRGTSRPAAFPPLQTSLPDLYTGRHTLAVPHPVRLGLLGISSFWHFISPSSSVRNPVDWIWFNKSRVNQPPARGQLFAPRIVGGFLEWDLSLRYPFVD